MDCELRGVTHGAANGATACPVGHSRISASAPGDLAQHQFRGSLKYAS